MISNYPDNMTNADFVSFGIIDEEEEPEECIYCGHTPCDGGSAQCKMD